MNHNEPPTLLRWTLAANPALPPAVMTELVADRVADRLSPTRPP
ncbi:hypothetical protein [Streptomyces amakusaensis]|uniref:Uncharacterized protein n=1 Tax=Streptomyces amakusaensis TaxID=67271 RepID=A0ABW0AMJ5_9ACTN